jgi:PhnB protein
VKSTPEGYHSVTPYLVIRDAARAIGFYQKAFGATELFRIADDQGRIGHAEIKIGDSPIMMSDEHPEMNCTSPQALGGTPVSLMVYVPDVDAVVAQAIAAGATPQQPIENKFYGDRSGSVIDPFGHIWHLATHIEDVPPDELKRRADAFMKEMAAKG